MRSAFALMGMGAAVSGLAASAYGCGPSPTGNDCVDKDICYYDASADTGGDGPVMQGDGAGDATNSDGSSGDGSSLDGGADGSLDAMVDSSDGFDGFTCDPTGAPQSEPCVIADAYGVFVASSGNDMTGNGTEANPYLTLGKALSSLGTKTRVYACADGAAYDEQITITTSVSLFGGFSCASNVWAYSGTASKLTASSASFGLKVDSVTTAVNVVDFEIDGANATAGGTSVAVLLNASPLVTFQRVTLVGGSGADGAQGANGSTTANYTGANAPNGNSATMMIVQGGVDTNTCHDTSTSSGGPGGTLSGVGTKGQPAYAPVNPAGDDGLGGTTGVSCSHGGGGDDGSYGPGGIAGTATATAGVFVIATGIWTPTTGGSGGNGQPGQGGGGGAGSATAAGGGGGAGGCGGAGGGGGVGGGASFALLAVNSPAMLADTMVNGAKAGAGGMGGAGDTGQGGGGDGAGATTACAGGNGAPGGGGGGGAGGAGGVSAAVAYVGTAPTIGTGSTVNAFATAATSKGGGGAGASTGTNGVAGNTGNAMTPSGMLMLPSM
jgi:hypothetical protein